MVCQVQSYQKVFPICVGPVSCLVVQELEVELKACVGIHHRTVLERQRGRFPHRVLSRDHITSQRRGLSTELTLFLVVVMAHAAAVSHLKVAVQFWYSRNCGCSDCAEFNTNSVRNTRNLELEDVAPQMRGNLLRTLWSTPSGCEWCM